LTVDFVVFDHEGKCLFIRRKNDPFKGCIALPGGYVEKCEETRDAAFRELQEETGIKLIDFLTFGLLGVYDTPNRDPREPWSVTVAYMGTLKTKDNVMAGDDAESIEWWEPDNPDLPDVAFDHYDIVCDACRKLYSCLR
jgi:8-oxo-dGTP diphosphatase